MANVPRIGESQGDACRHRRWFRCGSRARRCAGKVPGAEGRRPVIQALHGAAVVERKQGVFFASAGYSPEGVNWANRAGIPLFRFDLQGTPEAANQPSESQMAQVLEGRGTR